MKLHPHLLLFLRSKRIAFFVDIFFFTLITLVVHKLWWTFSPVIYSTPVFQEISLWLANEVFQVSGWININILRIDMSLNPGNIMTFFKNNHSFFINESCSGFKQMFQVFFLFLIFPGPWKHKFWFIPAGMVFIFFVNVIRIIGLSYAMIMMPERWDFIHIWVMRPFYYIGIFVIWMIWVEKFRRRPVVTEETTILKYIAKEYEQ